MDNILALSVEAGERYSADCRGEKGHRVTHCRSPPLDITTHMYSSRSRPDEMKKGALTAESLV